MEFQLLPIFTFFSLVLVASHAALSPEAYWKSVLPNTPMPKAVKDLLRPEYMEDKSTSVDVGNGGVHVNVGHKGKPGGTHVGVGKGGGVNVGVGKGKPGGVNVGVGGGRGKPGGVNVGVGGGRGKPSGVNVGVGGGGVNVGVGAGHHHHHPPGKPVYVGVHPGQPFLYKYAATETQLQDDPNIALFFREKDLKPGISMTLHFTKTTTKPTTFLPRDAAEKIPFSSEKLPEILNHFSLRPTSKEAQTMKATIQECEEPANKGEEKYCATSLESMVDFTTSKLGKDVRAISTEVMDRTGKPEKHSIAGAERATSGDKAVVCHKEDYPYAVFFCHKTSATRAYTVSLTGDSGGGTAVAVCHTNTATWNPKHLAFEVLKVKPGSVPICHFLPGDHIVWVPNN
ncbi:hypothetical protein NMG60_11000855 [Bertholletia excelsa]